MNGAMKIAGIPVAWEWSNATLIIKVDYEGEAWACIVTPDAKYIVYHPNDAKVTPERTKAVAEICRTIGIIMGCGRSKAIH